MARGKLVAPGVAFCFTVTGCAWGPPILSGYGDYYFRGQRRPVELAPHSGVDFGGGLGVPILAAADGDVYALIPSHTRCGTGVAIAHGEYPLSRFTVYCHLQERFVKHGQRVRRGEIIGLMGDTGVTGGVPHLHFELNLTGTSHPTAIPGISFDPMPFIVGCFEPNKTYPTDRLVLTHPVKCKD